MDHLDNLALKPCLDQQGFVHLEKQYSHEQFIHLSKMLGVCDNLSEIHLIQGSRAYLHNPTAVPLHTDSPLIRYIGWHCQTQDVTEGASILSDSSSILSGLKPQEVDLLKNTILLYPDQLYSMQETYLLIEKQSKNRLYYAPWLIKEKSQATKIKFFSDKLQENAFRIRLTPGEILFVDNHRMLHGRDNLPPDSSRKLNRIWIRED